MQDSWSSSVGKDLRERLRQCSSNLERSGHKHLLELKVKIKCLKQIIGRLRGHWDDSGVKELKEA